jgi:hypothetical protein
MGINSVILTWFDELETAGVFKGQSSVLELGPQDNFFPAKQFEEVACRKLGAARGASCAGQVFNDQIAFDEQRKAFYAPFGLEKYKSLDVYDDRSDYKLDLNSAVRAPEPFDVIVDCGTTEHVYNAGNVFVFSHNTLPVGGITLKVLPTFGDNTHGFYNIHPTVYFDIARENGYQILDFRYIDSMTARAETDARSLLGAAEFETALKYFAGCQELQENITRRFGVNTLKSQRSGMIKQSHGTVDYCFVAMRKLKDAPFRYPGQGVYLSEFPEPERTQTNSLSEMVPSPEKDEPGPDQSGEDQELGILYGAEFAEMWKMVREFTMVSEERAFATYKACRHVCLNAIPGDFVECGVYRGGMGILAAL